VESDLEHATKTADYMLTKLGMDQSEKSKREKELAIERTLCECKEITRKMLTESVKQLEMGANKLFKEETLTGEQISFLSFFSFLVFSFLVFSFLVFSFLVFSFLVFSFLVSPLAFPFCHRECSHTSLHQRE
jgi:hypothetical protein